MSVARAKRLCPQALYVAPDFTRYREVSRQVRAIFARHTDLIEPLSLDEAYLDVTENKKGLPSATEVASEIRREIFDVTRLTASAGIAPNKFLAKIASDWNKPDGLFVIKPAQVMTFLQTLPVRKVPGVGKVTQGKLEAIGVHTVGDLARFNELELEHHFGRYGIRLFELAQGIDNRAVEPDSPLQQISAETTLMVDERLHALAPVLDRLAEKVWDQGIKKGAIGRTVVLKLKTDRFRLLTRTMTLTQAPRSAHDLAMVAHQLCTRVDLPDSTLYRLAGVGMSNFEDLATQSRQVMLDLFDEETTGVVSSETT
jgi:DNA polymerase-4